ncbi:MAG: hypothetical protein KGL39_36280 [Patescibacteria group bacterium]|nr:hypothetical protein [Patescibacteria group bacterium]
MAKLKARAPYWSGKKRGPFSAEVRAKMSATHLSVAKRGRDHHLFGRSPAHRKRLSYGGVLMRSSYEVRFAQLLDRSCVRWEYEPQRFDLGNTTYAPDFYLPEHGLYCEVKGWLTVESDQKMQLFRERYPSLRLILIPKMFFTAKLDRGFALAA